MVDSVDLKKISNEFELAWIGCASGYRTLVRATLSTPLGGVRWLVMHAHPSYPTAVYVT